MNYGHTETLYDEQEEIQVLSDLCRRSYYDFFLEFWETVSNETLVNNWHIEYICDQLQKVAERVFLKQDGERKYRDAKQYDLIVNVPPGTSKSTICTILFPAWLWVNDPTIVTISSSYSLSLSTEHAVKTRDVLKSEKFKLFYGDTFEFKPDSDNKTNYKNTKGGARIVTATGGTITGKHGHFIIVDDPLNPEQAASEVELETANRFISRTLSSRKIDKEVSVTILIMQRLHEKDPTGDLLSRKREKIRHICLPAEIYGDPAKINVSPPELVAKYIDGKLDPVRLSDAVLKEAKSELGSYGYAGQMKQKPAPDEGGIFKREWFSRISLRDFQEKIARLRDEKKSYDVDVFIDPAFTDKSNNDPSGLTHFAYIDKVLYVIYHTDQWLEMPELLDFCEEFVADDLYQPVDAQVALRIEPKASGLSLKQSLKDRKCNAVLTPPPLKDKTARANGVTPFVESGKVVLVEGGWNESWLDSVCMFPNAEHDEPVDNLTAGITYYKKKAAWAL